LQTQMEGMKSAIWRDVPGFELPTPFRRMTYEEAMARYGVDKPDLRLDLVLADVSEAARGSGFRVFDHVVEQGGIVKCMRVPDGDRLSRSQLDALTDFAKPYGIKGVAFARVEEGGTWKAPFAKNVSESARNAINQAADAKTGDVLLFVADRAKAANTCMGAIRLHVGRKLDMLRESEWRFMWLV